MFSSTPNLMHAIRSVDAFLPHFPFEVERVVYQYSSSTAVSATTAGRRAFSSIIGIIAFRDRETTVLV